MKTNVLLQGEIWIGGNYLWRARLFSKVSPWLSTKLAANCWLIVQRDRTQELIDKRYVITGVTR